MSTQLAGASSGLLSGRRRRDALHVVDDRERAIAAIKTGDDAFAVDLCALRGADWLHSVIAEWAEEFDCDLDAAPPVARGVVQAAVMRAELGDGGGMRTLPWALGDLTFGHDAGPWLGRLGSVWSEQILAWYRSEILDGAQPRDLRLNQHVRVYTAREVTRGLAARADGGAAAGAVTLVNQVNAELRRRRWDVATADSLPAGLEAAAEALTHDLCPGTAPPTAEFLYAGLDRRLEQARYLRARHLWRDLVEARRLEAANLLVEMTCERFDERSCYRHLVAVGFDRCRGGDHPELERLGGLVRTRRSRWSLRRQLARRCFLSSLCESYLRALSLEDGADRLAAPLKLIEAHSSRA